MKMRICGYLLSLLLTAHAQSPICPFGKVLSQCYSGCSPECGTMGSPVQPDQCPSCSSGCFCKPGLYQFGDLCLPKESCPSIDFSSITVVDKCSHYADCNDCISSDPDCQWCPYEPGDNSVIGSRCRLKDTNPLCTVQVEDPQPSITALVNETFGDTVQIQPQKLRLQLRRGQPEVFTLNFKAAENFPLDVYFLLDLSGSFSREFRVTVPLLAADLLDALSEISNQYAVAFGGFTDKRAIPYAFPSQDPLTYQNVGPPKRCTNPFIIDLEDCNPTISFRHTTNFSQFNQDELAEVLQNISIHLNIDGLEGGMDGVAQVLACPKKIGWRDQSLRMLLYMSNAAFHLAGDGKLGAVLDPYPGVCGLETRTENGISFEDYVYDTRYDYPSVYQLREMARNTETNIVFAITDYTSEEIYRFRQPDPHARGSLLLSLREGLASETSSMAEILSPFGHVVALEANSSNIISVIQDTFNDISQEVVLSPRDFHPDLEFDYTPGHGCGGAEIGLCTNVAIGETASVDVTVTMTECLDGPTTVILASPAFGSVELLIEPLCNCDCSAEIADNSELCEGIGGLQCGQCQCPTGRAGEMCECEVPPPGEPPTCEIGLGGLECSGPARGECDCGTCKCFVQEQLLVMKNVTELYFGTSCECDHFHSCGGDLTDDGKLCSGNGKCNCAEDRCECFSVMVGGVELSYGGDQCECDPSKCYSQEHDGVCVYTGSLENPSNAECDPCNGCLCQAGARQGPDGTCVPQSNQCQQSAECARCTKGLQGEDTDCAVLGCNAQLYSGQNEPFGEDCTFKDEEGCIHRFYVQSSIIYVDEEKYCTANTERGVSNLAWIIPVNIIAVLLVVLGALIPFVIIYIKFKKVVKDANMDQQGDHFYETIDTARNKKRSRGSCCMICKVTVANEYETPETVYETVDNVSGSNRIGNVNHGERPSARGVVDPDTNDNMAYGVTKRVVTALNPAYEATYLQ